MEQTRLRVVVLNYNRANLTLNCVESLRKQTYQALDIVVVDNRSQEAEQQLLRDRLPPGVVLIVSDTNRGYAAGNNLGLKSSALPYSPYLMVVNNDVTFPDARTIEKLLTAIEADESYVACSPLVHNPAVGPVESANAQYQIRRVPRFWQAVVIYSWWLSRLFPASGRHHVYADIMPFELDSVIPCETINGSCFVIKTSFIEEIGYLDEGTFLYFEELILGASVARAGKKACLATATVVQHAQGATTGETVAVYSVRRRISALKSELHFSHKYLGASLMARCVLVVVRVLDIASKWLILRTVRLIKGTRCEKAHGVARAVF